MVGGATMSGTGAAKERKKKGKRKGYLPNEKVPHSKVYPIPGWGSHEISAGKWLVHILGWVGVPENAEDDDISTREEVLEFADITDVTAKIDGEQIPNADQYWREPVQVEEGYAIYWKYATPPKSIGKHLFELDWEYTEDYYYDEEVEENPVREEGTTDSFSAEYSIVEGRVHGP